MVSMTSIKVKITSVHFKIFKQVYLKKKSHMTNTVKQFKMPQVRQVKFYYFISLWFKESILKKQKKQTQNALAITTGP